MSQTTTGQAGQVGRVGRESQGHVLDRVAGFLTDYVALPECVALVISAWIGAAWMYEVWDRFPHLAITSPEKRCGKTTLLDLLAVIVPRPLPTSNISPAALYRVIQKERPTLLFDEAQSLSRVGSEAGEVNREILNAGIGRNAQVVRCGGANNEKIRKFPIYSPKVFAMIGELDGVLADRSLPVTMTRKTKDVAVQRYRSRIVESRGADLKTELEQWAEENKESAVELYDVLEPFDIGNDRMADLLLPLQCALVIAGSGIEVLEKYAALLDERDRQQETQTPGVRLLAACRELFGDGVQFKPTTTLIADLVERTEEPWHRWNKGEGMNPEALARLLRPYGITSQHNKQRTNRGYFASDFKEAWDRYLAPSGQPSNPSKVSRPSKG